MQLAIVVLIEPLEKFTWSKCPHARSAAGCTGSHPLSGLLEVFRRDRIFVLPLHHFAKESSRTIFWNFFLLQFAIFVLVEPFEHLLEVDHRPPTSTARAAIRATTLHWCIASLDRGVIFRLRQFAVVVLVTQTHEPIEKPTLLFRDFIRCQLTISVFVEPLEQLFLLRRIRLFRVVLSKRRHWQPDQSRREQCPKIDPLHNVIPDE